MRRRIHRQMSMASMRARSCAFCRAWRCMRSLTRTRWRRRRSRRGGGRLCLREGAELHDSAGFACAARWQDGACASCADAGAAGVADCVVARHAEYGGDQREVRRGCSVQRAWRGWRADGGCGGVGRSCRRAEVRRGASCRCGGAQVTGRVSGAPLPAVCGGRQAGDRGGHCGRTGQGGREHRFPAAASGASQASAAVCGDDGALLDLDHGKGRGGDGARWTACWSGRCACSY